MASLICIRSIAHAAVDVMASQSSAASRALSVSALTRASARLLYCVARYDIGVKSGCPFFTAVKNVPVLKSHTV